MLKQSGRAPLTTPPRTRGPRAAEHKRAAAVRAARTNPHESKDRRRTPSATPRGKHAEPDGPVLRRARTLNLNVCTRRAGARARGGIANSPHLHALHRRGHPHRHRPPRRDGADRSHLPRRHHRKGGAPLTLSLSLCLTLALSVSLSVASLTLTLFCLSLEAPAQWVTAEELPPPGDRGPPPGVACAPEVAAPCAAGGGPAVAAVGTGDFGFTVKPKTKTKSSCTDAPNLADACVQTIAFKAMPPKPTAMTFKAPPPMPKPPPPAPATTKFGVGSQASTSGLNEAFTS